MTGKNSRIIVFKNADKEGWYENWGWERDWLDFPHPFRLIVSANPGCGKTNLMKNVLIHAKPYFKKIFLCHFDLETKEYDDIDVIKMDKIPNAKSPHFKNTEKNVLIIDDYDFKGLQKDDLNNLRSLYKYTSTHKGLSIMLATQDFFNVPAMIRRLSNVYFIWKGSCDLDSLYQVGRRVGFTKPEFKELLDLCKDKFDNICIDMTVDTPAPVRLNGYILIKGRPNYLKKEEEEINQLSLEATQLDKKQKVAELKDILGQTK